MPATTAKTTASAAPNLWLLAVAQLEVFRRTSHSRCSLRCRRHEWVGALVLPCYRPPLIDNFLRRWLPSDPMCTLPPYAKVRSIRPWGYRKRAHTTTTLPAVPRQAEVSPPRLTTTDTSVCRDG